MWFELFDEQHPDPPRPREADPAKVLALENSTKILVRMLRQLKPMLSEKEALEKITRLVFYD